MLAASCEEMSDFARLRRLKAVVSVPYVNCKPFSDGTGPLVNSTMRALSGPQLLQPNVNKSALVNGSFCGGGCKKRTRREAGRLGVRDAGLASVTGNLI